MRFNIPDEQSQKAKIPHEIFLSNLIGNHILWFVAALGVARSHWLPVAMVPVVSILTLAYILWRARRARQVDDWFVMCHWQLAARRSKVFIITLCILLSICALGWVGYTYLGMMEVAVYAIIGGVGILPVMVTVLVLIIMESDALHQASQHRMPKSLPERYPNPGVEVVEEPGDTAPSPSEPA
jgi:hypothetical protein